MNKGLRRELISKGIRVKDFYGNKYNVVGFYPEGSVALRRGVDGMPVEMEMIEPNVFPLIAL